MPGQGQAGPRPAAAAAGNSGGRGSWQPLVAAEFGWWQSSDDIYSALAWNTYTLTRQHRYYVDTSISVVCCQAELQGI